MAFDVYPNPHTAPMSIPGGGGAGSTTTLAQERRSTEAQPTMYIRVAAVSAGVAPTFKLAAGSGDAVALDPSGFTEAIFDQPGDTGNYVADVKYVAEANGVYLISTFLYSNAPSTWKLTIINNDAAAREFTFVAAETNPEASQPWMDAALTLQWHVLINESGPLTLRLFNKGTGPLSGVAGAVSGSDAASFSLTPVSGAINPSGFQDAAVNLAAFVSTKNASAALTLTSNDTTLQTTAGHNGTVALTATVEQLELGFSLDASGSMAYGPNGEHFVGIDNNSTRWGKLKSAAQATLVVLKNFAANKGTFGVNIYPNITTFPPDPTAAYGGPFPVPSPSSFTLDAAKPISDGNVADAAAQIDAHFPRENGAATPMGAGIANAIGISNVGPWGFFSGPPVPSLSRRWLILMSDGNHNSGPPDPSDFYDGKAAGFAAKTINVTTLGYGNATAPLEPVNTTLLTTIASQGGGDASRYHDAQSDANSELTTNFLKSLLLSGLTLDTISDPSGDLTTANPTVTRQIGVTEFDRKVSFIVYWPTYAAGRLQVSVTTPLGEVLTDSSGGVVVDTNPRFHMITVDSNFIRNERQPAKPRYGTWLLTITLPQPVGVVLKGDADQEHYDYQVIIDSRLKLTATLNQKTFAAGDQIDLSARLLLDGMGVPNASVKLTRVTPGSSALNWLANSAVTADEYSSAANAQASNPDNDSLGIKKLALYNKGETFSGFGNSSSVNMVDANDTGVYVAATSNTAVPGTYDFLITATGALPDGTAFRRERAVSVHSVVRPDPIWTLFHVDYTQVGTQTTATLTVKPGDRFGNVVLIDPRFDPTVLFTSHGGAFQGPIVDNHDGSYSQPITYPSGQPPVVGVTVGGTPVVNPTPLVPLGDLKWVDKVYGFKLGTEAAAGANKHRDPQACLGDFLTKPRPEFVSLGGHGAIAVGISGHYIVARGYEDDFTVFVHPDRSPRPYKVYAVRGDLDADDWVEVGRSNGGTQSFGLRAAGVRLARAILIYDISNRLRDPDGPISASPGTSVVAVGIRASEVAGHGGFDDSICDWLRRLGHGFFH
jgi:hypothetical protein